MEISVDDRQKYNSMYGTVITVHYYDEGESSFEVKVQEEEPGKNTGEDRVVGTVQLTGSNTWKSASFYTTAWGRSQRNHGEDMRKEIILNNIGDDMVYYAGVDVDYVPSREWKEQILKASGETQKERELNGSVARVTLEKGQRASSLVIPVRTVNETGESDLIMRVKAVLPDGSQQAVTAKEYYMASEKHDEVILPVSEAPGNTVGFEVEMETLSGKQAVFTDKTGEPAVEVRGYTEKAASESRAYGDGIHEAMEPFSGIRVDKSQEGRPFVLYRWMDGEYRAIERGSVYGGEVNTEPQTAGLYRLEIEGKGVCGRVKGLERLEASNEATGYCLGTELAAGFETDGEAMWTPVWNLKAIEKGEEGGLTARLSGTEPVLESAELQVEAKKEQIFRFVLKNETGSNFVRVYWKGENGYGERQSALIPVVANDDRYREYSWPIGLEDGYTGTITGLRVNPATGESTTGRISLLTMELRDGGTDWTGSIEPLDIRGLAASAGAQFKLQDGGIGKGE